MPKTYTDEELELLTEDERAGLEEEDDQGADDEGSDDGEQDDDGAEEQDDGAEEEGDDEGADEGADDEEGADDKGEGADSEGSDDGEQPEQARKQRVPLIQADQIDPEEVKTQKAALDTREDEATQKFDDGDMTTAEYRAELRKIQEERGELDWKVKKAELASETAKQQAANDWFSEVERFAADFPEVAKSQLKWQSFDLVVRQVTADEANHKLSDRAQLEKAYKLWAEEMGIKADEKAEPKKEEKRKGKAIPPTLAKVPASDIEDTDGGQFGQLNRLFNSSRPSDVVKAEEMLAKMSEADQDRFLASQ